LPQYRGPPPRHYPVERWVRPEEFVELREEAETLGFSGVMSGPLVRSSYRAGRLYEQAIAARCATARSAIFLNIAGHSPPGAGGSASVPVGAVLHGTRPDSLV